VDEAAFETQVPIRDQTGALATAVLSCSVRFLNEGRSSTRECRIHLLAPGTAIDGNGEDFFESLCREPSSSSRRGAGYSVTEPASMCSPPGCCGTWASACKRIGSSPE
jgi:hypothetical protein